MNILLLNSIDTLGGAAKAAHRLCNGLRQAELQATMLVQRKLSNDPFVVGPTGLVRRWLAMLRPHIDALPVCLYPERSRLIFSPAYLPGGFGRDIVSFKPDIVHLHWICEGFLQLEALCRVKVPIIWTLHDSWPFTGGCHLPFECRHYEDSCGYCPALASKREQDLSRWIWKRKKAVFESLNMVLVAPSRWMAERARESALFRTRRIEVIPNGLDLACFSRIDKTSARGRLALPQDRRYILYNGLGGDHPNKGLVYLRDALRTMRDRGQMKNTELLVIGSEVDRTITALGIAARSLGRLSDEASIAMAYSAADVTVVPSRMENLPNTIMESMACGTPCAAFRIGGVPDLIDHLYNGYLAKPYKADDLAGGIFHMIQNHSEYDQLARNGRYKIENHFSQEAMSKSYVKLYNELLGETRR